MTFATQEEELAQNARDSAYWAQQTAAEAARYQQEVTALQNARTLGETVAAMWSQYGLGSLGQWVIAMAVEGKNAEQIAIEIRKRDEYKARFPAMEALRLKAAQGGGVPINEGDYLALERSYRQVFQAAGLPPTMWDTPDDYARLITADISAIEVQRRIAAAREAVDSTDANVRNQLAALYGITTTDLVAYALDPEKNSDYIQRVATTSRIAGYSQTAGLGGMSRQAWEGYAQDLINQQVGDSQLREIIGDANARAEIQGRLAGIEGEQFTSGDALDIAVRKDSNKTLASQKRVEREKARFSGSQGLTTGSLRGSGI
jgi:hypothetical protein